MADELVEDVPHTSSGFKRSPPPLEPRPKEDYIEMAHIACPNHKDESSVFNMRLIAEVKARPYLYDHMNEGYSVTPWRNAAWQEIADVLESSPEAVKTRWKTLRDRFKKEEKKERASGKQSVWVFQKPLRFVQRLRSDGVSDEGEQVSPMEAAISFIHQEITRNDKDVQQSSTSPVLEPPHRDDETMPPSYKRSRLSITESTSCIRASPHPSSSVAEDDEDEMFTRMVLMRLARLSPALRDKAKLRMLSALFEVASSTEE